jgi:anti-sigma regulatory factor (Ser/Thr protein kinase)
VILPPSRRTGTGNDVANHPNGSKILSSVGPASHTYSQDNLSSPQWSYLELAALPTAPSCARLHSKQVLWEWGCTDLSEVSELIVSELVTNAAQITVAHELQTPVRLWLSCYRKRLLIEVWDGDGTPPGIKELDANGVPPVSHPGGRGLFLVASLSNRWGWYPERALGGKVVWVEVAV